MKKRIITFLVILLLLQVGIFAKGTNESATNGNDQEKILTPFTTLQNDYFLEWKRGAQQAAAALGAVTVDAVNEGDTELQVNQVQTMLKNNINMVMNCSPDSSNIATLAKLCQENEAYFVNNHESPEWLIPADVGDYYAVVAFADNIDFGYQMAKLLFEEIGGKGKILHISGWPGNLPDKLRTLGLEKALAEYPEIELLASQPGKYSRVDSRKIMEDFIIAYPDFDGVFCQSDEVAIGAMTACEEAGIKVPITGIDGNKVTMQYVKEGRIFAIMAQHPAWHAGWATVMAWDAAHGWKPSPAERMLQFEGGIITKENVDWYFDLMWGNDTLPFDWAKMSRVLNPESWDVQNGVKPLDPNVFWDGVPMPKGYSLPSIYGKGYTEDFARVVKLYQDHNKNKAFLMD